MSRASFLQKVAQRNKRLLVLPQFSLPVARAESYPLGGYLYNRSKAHDDLIKARVRWQNFVRDLPDADREAVEKIERLFHKIALDKAKRGA